MQLLVTQFTIKMFHIQPCIRT